MLKSFRLALLLVLAIHAAAAAASTPQLYAGEIAVADESSAARNAALSELLSGVLVRVTGNAALGGQAAVREILAAAPSLVEQYRYRTLEREGELVRLLWARFDRQAVERMLRERGIPVWTQRPRVLLWVGTEQGAQRSLLRLDEVPAARAALLARAEQRGMPLQLPLLDLEDQGRLTPADLWSDYQPGISQASARYPHDQVLSGRLRDLGGGRWSGVWSLADRSGDVQSFEIAPQALPEALAAAVDRAQDLLAARYAPLAGSASGGTLVRFAGVAELDDYARLLALLRDLDGVSAPVLRRVEGDDFTFELTAAGGADNLPRALAASGQLLAEPVPLRPAWQQPAQAQPGPLQPEAELVYRLRR